MKLTPTPLCAKRKHKWQLKASAAVMAALALVMVLSWLFLSQELLVLRNEANGQIRFAAPIEEEEEFSFSYIHSVNKSYVEEFYQPRQGQIYLLRLKYKAFGAGMANEADADAGQTLRYEDGYMIIDGYDQRLYGLCYFVARNADFRLHYRDEEVALAALDEAGASLRVEVLPRWQRLLD